ncbi:tissue factor pathway inhibitor [Biomphalaria pfeifferi]|uniref:Tissue factor pathway inhibitor n=1 Tax=Biomphalaria pfeifferi TaxID=112525 RepID=A0AAD8AV41_BIOPF|nr:tissue factor pathway inhibitor [Biomphalaria pfeifferi]
MNVRERNVFHSMFLVVCVLTALCSQDNVFVLSQHVEESLPHNSRDLIMREDGQEMFYNVDIDKYQALGIKCPQPDPPENGFIVGTGTRVGSVVYVRCKEGFRLEGPTVMACVPTPKSAHWDPRIRRECVEGGTYFNDETNMNEGKTMDQGTLLKHPDNRPMENSNPSFIGPKAHAYWTRHQSKVEHESEEEENQGQEEDYDQIADQCLHLPDPGPCRASFKRFYFNKATFECYPFIYGGCLGNHNNFESIQDCHLTCLKHD